jgi:hypothetical protein
MLSQKQPGGDEPVGKSFYSFCRIEGAKARIKQLCWIKSSAREKGTRQEQLQIWESVSTQESDGRKQNKYRF